MLNRSIQQRLIYLSKQFPATLILGARQVGKTTLAKMVFPNDDYIDLENPKNFQLFKQDILYQLELYAEKTVILDEIQVLPEAFSALRSIIDQDRSRKQQFILLGSANPTLIRHISESLAGRMGVLELPPLTAQEIPTIDYRTLWLKGGFPDAVSGDFRTWWDAYLKIYLERDLSFWGLSIDPLLMRKLLTMLAHQQGCVLNASSLSRSLAISYHTVQKYLNILESTFILRSLHPYYKNIKKRLVRSPKIYIRDTGLLHHLLNINTIDELESHPIQGQSWETFVIEEIIRREQVVNPFTQFYFWRTQAGAEADLIIERGSQLHIVEIKSGIIIKNDQIKRISEVLGDIQAKNAFFINHSNEIRSLSPNIKAVGFGVDKTWLP